MVKIEQGLITVKEAYRYIKQVQQGTVEWGWFRKIWTWKLPLKLKCFGWLAGRNELLTWDNLCCRGFTEPGRFFRVRQAPEDLTHLLLTCPVVVSIWIAVLSILKISTDWKFGIQYSWPLVHLDWKMWYKEYCTLPFLCHVGHVQISK